MARLLGDGGFRTGQPCDEEMARSPRAVTDESEN